MICLPTWLCFKHHTSMEFQASLLDTDANYIHIHIVIRYSYYCQKNQSKTSVLGSFLDPPRSLQPNRTETSGHSRFAIERYDDVFPWFSRKISNGLWWLSKMSTQPKPIYLKISWLDMAWKECNRIDNCKSWVFSCLTKQILLIKEPTKSFLNAHHKCLVDVYVT